MRTKIFLFLFVSGFAESVSCQITKGYWLLGGNASYSRLKSNSAASINYTQTDAQLNCGVGYFLIDKLNLGLKPSFSFGGNTFNTNSVKTFGIGPFVRYYFLKPEKTINLFAETSFLYQNIIGSNGNGNNSRQKTNSFTFLAGPVIFFNPSVALELTFGYTSTSISGFENTNNKTQFGIGFQFHLIKEKN
jgi:hypothetical protein